MTIKQLIFQIFSAKINTRGSVPERKTKSENMAKSAGKRENMEETSVKSEAPREVIPYGGLGSSLDPKLLDKVKNLCRECGQYRGCGGQCG